MSRAVHVSAIEVEIRGKVVMLNMDEAHALLEDLNRAIYSESKESARIRVAVCNAYGITLAEMNSTRRPDRLAFPRQVAMWMMRRLTDERLEDIAAHFPKPGKRRHHSTVSHAVRRVSDIMATDAKAASKINNLLTELQTKP